MKNYLKETGLDRPGMEEQPLFRNPRGEKLTRQGIAYILGKYTEACHLAEMSPHQVRNPNLNKIQTFHRKAYK